MSHRRTFFIGDTHFCHKNILLFAGAYRPGATVPEHDEILIHRWNSVVNPEDKVYHLGDFCFGGWSNIAIAGRLNGRKHLIMGNHDHYPSEEFLKYFDKVDGAFPYRDGIMTHMPVHESQLERFAFNIHGHLHHFKVMKWIMRQRPRGDYIDELPEQVPDERYINVSCEQINCTPIEESKVVSQFEFINNQ
jgi:calcineurin-like phosphoesterase family protein